MVLYRSVFLLLFEVFCEIAVFEYRECFSVAGLGGDRQVFRADHKIDVRRRVVYARFLLLGFGHFVAALDAGGVCSAYGEVTACVLVEQRLVE